MGVERKCGDCIVCCVYLNIDVPELKKKALSHCPHVQAHADEVVGESVCFSGKGCTIYEKRPPDPCRGYRCEWLDGHGAEEDRPDRSGVLVDRMKNIKNAVEVRQLWYGAADLPAGQEAIERISESAAKAALVISFKERRLVRVVGRAS